MLDAGPVAVDLRMALHRINRRMRQEYPAGSLSLTQLSALATVWRDGPITAGDLANSEHVRPPSITRVVGTLEAAGLVTREANPADGRQVLIRVTTAGASTMQETIQATQTWLTAQVESLGEEDRAVLRRATDLLVAMAGQ